MVLGIGPNAVMECRLLALSQPPGNGVTGHDRGGLPHPVRFGAEQVVELVRQGHMEIVAHGFHRAPPPTLLWQKIGHNNMARFAVCPENLKLFINLTFSHSPEFSGGVCSLSSKAA